MSSSEKTEVTEQRLVESIAHFQRYLESPWRLVWVNFLGGIFRGLGTAVGATIVFAVLVWFLASLVDLPVIGHSIARLQEEIERYADATQYEDEFKRLESELQGIRQAVSSE